VLTNPPFLARNKCKDKTVFDLYQTNDLYKCFLLSLVNTPCAGGLLIIPSGFFFGTRDVDVKCRSRFMETYRVSKVKYFEEQVFDDTPTTVVAFLFHKKADPESEAQKVLWVSKEKQRVFVQSPENDYVPFVEHFPMEPLRHALPILVRRHVGPKHTADPRLLTSMTLHALDTSKRICLEYKPGYVYESKVSGRSFATLVSVVEPLSEDHQQRVCQAFNEWLESARELNWSLFLPAFREFDRKRLSFETAYRIISYFITLTK
jgi:hypothetical protein